MATIDDNKIIKFEIDESKVPLPKSRKAVAMMTCWGKKKRQQYAELVVKYKLTTEMAFYYTEFQEGKV